MTNGPTITLGQHSAIGPKERNDDSYGILVPDEPLLTTKGIAMAIADGMSSSEGGKEASESCVKNFLNDYYSTHESWTVKTSVRRILTAINSWLYAQGQTQYLSNKGMVTTFSCLILKSSTAHIFHVGDSRIYLLRDGDIEPLTNDHRVRVSKDKEYLARAFGIEPNLEVDYRTMPILAGDVLIFTTDGVHDFLKDAEIVSLVDGAQGDLNDVASAVVSAALEKNSDDNITCQIVRVDDPGADDEDTHTQKLQALPFPPELEPGMVLDGYRIQRELHASNRTQVYLAADEESGELVVIKTPSVNFEDDAAYLELFTREEWVGQLISNAHVLKVIKPAHGRRFLYYVSEYVEGQSLRQWMHDNPSPDLQDVRRIVEQIAAGLRAFHRKEMVHQDLKPENILIDKHGTVKIIDFGSTHVAGLDEIASPLESPELLGTRGYIAPEYLLHYKPTNRSDIFSLGVIAYEMLTGELPYGEGFTTERSVTKLKYRSTNELKANVPPWVDGALRKAVHRDPERRYGQMSHFVADITSANPDFATEMQSLLERNPVVFWRGVALASLLINLTLVFAYAL